MNGEMRVRLTVDLTEYDPRCTLGSEGITGPPCSMWARQSDCFTGVYFDSGARLDVAWKSLTALLPAAPDYAKERDRLTAKRGRILETFEDGYLTEDEMNAKISQVDGELAQIERHLS